MGTAGAYSGSGGAGWGAARSDARNLPATPSDDDLNDLLSSAAQAINWADAEDEEPPITEQEEESAAGAGAQGPPARVRPKRGGGGGGGPIAAGVGSGRPGSASGSGGARRGRSRARAARAGARGAAAAFGLLTGDAAGLAALGLNLTELAGLDAFDQCARILQTLEGPPTTIEDAELQRANAEALLRILKAETAPSPEETVRIHVAEYVFQVMLTELGSELRSGDRPGQATAQYERRMRNLIQALVDDIPLQATSVSVESLERAIFETLTTTRDVMSRRGQ